MQFFIENFPLESDGNPP